MVIIRFVFMGEFLSHIINIFMTLPEEFRPIHFSDDEIINSRRAVSDSVAFNNFFTNRETGFLRFGPIIDCLVVDRGKIFTVSCWCENSTTAARTILTHLSSARPVFGFACHEEEQMNSNRVTTTFGINALESWVGRDPTKYIPGLYWLTLLPAYLAAEHQIDLSALKDVALEHIAVDRDQHLFRFYDHPSDWATADKVAALRASSPGIFDIRPLAANLLAAKTFAEVEALLAPWP